MSILDNLIISPRLHAFYLTKDKSIETEKKNALAMGLKVPEQNGFSADIAPTTVSTYQLVYLH